MLQNKVLASVAEDDDTHAYRSSDLHSRCKN